MLKNLHGHTVVYLKMGVPVNLFFWGINVSEGCVVLNHNNWVPQFPILAVEQTLPLKVCCEHVYALNTKMKKNEHIGFGDSTIKVQTFLFGFLLRPWKIPSLCFCAVCAVNERRCCTWGTPGTPFLVQIHKSCFFRVFDGFHVQDRRFTPFPIAERFFTSFWLNCVQITFRLHSNCVQITFNYVQLAPKIRYNVTVWKRLTKSRPGQQFLSNFPIVYFCSPGQEKVSWGCPRYWFNG